MNHVKHPIGEINGGWGIILKLGLLLVVPGIGAQIWMARSVVLVDTKIIYLSDTIDHLHQVSDIMEARLNKLELDIHKRPPAQP